MSLLSGFEHFITENEPLAAHTWLRVGGPAEFFAEPTNEEELAALVRRCREDEVPMRLLGGGSNVLVRDEGAPGMVVRLGSPAFGGISVKEATVTAGGGAKLGHVISASVREGLAGLEPLIGVPGTVGGALHGNAGSQGADIGQWVASATVLARSGELRVRSGDDIQFAYRQSSLNELAILSATFKLEPEDPVELTKRLQKLWIVKRSRLPPGSLNVARVFKNPIGYRAADLIEEAGLKGARIGEAEVSDRHANFIVANPGASSADVLRLIDLIRDRVAQRLSVDLELEIQIW